MMTCKSQKKPIFSIFLLFTFAISSCKICATDSSITIGQHVAAVLIIVTIALCVLIFQPLIKSISFTALLLLPRHASLIGCTGACSLGIT